MNINNFTKFAFASAVAGVMIGCQPEVVNTPPASSSTTVIHDKTPAASPSPSVIVTPPASSGSTHTETNTNTVTPPDGSTSTTTTQTTTTTG